MLPAAAAVVALACAAGTARAAQPIPYVDHDAAALPAGTPDISAIAVHNDDTYAYFGVAFNGAMPAKSYVDVFVDTDDNAMTGSVDDGGTDVLLEYDDESDTFGVYPWDAAQQKYVYKAGSGTRVSVVAGTVIFMVPRSMLTGATGFAFWAVAAFETPDGGLLYDEAPADNTWRYTFQKPDAPVNPDKVTLSAGPASMQQPVRAGSSWSVSLRAIRSDTGADLGSEGVVSCSASVGGATLHAARAAFVTTGSGFFKKVAAVCTWQLPKAAKGGTIKALITVTYHGAKTSHSFTAKVA